MDAHVAPYVLARSLTLITAEALWSWIRARGACDARDTAAVRLSWLSPLLEGRRGPQPLQAGVRAGRGLRSGSPGCPRVIVGCGGSDVTAQHPILVVACVSATAWRRGALCGGAG